MPLQSSQGATVSFGGVSLGMATSIRWEGGSASGTDVTSGENVRTNGGLPYAMRELDVTVADPGSCTVDFFVQGSVSLEAGQSGTLSVSIGGASFSGNAFVSGFGVEANVGEYARGFATFTMKGT